jgi:16S rRNA (cytidine1402-2'-O)-methyltransferase
MKKIAIPNPKSPIRNSQPMSLFLIPVPISEAALHTLPVHTLDVARRLDFFIVERAKTARRFLKAIGIERPIQEIEVVEIGENDLQPAIAAFLDAVRAGRDVGLMSEAGCPGVADPGAVSWRWRTRKTCAWRP